MKTENANLDSKNTQEQMQVPVFTIRDIDSDHLGTLAPSQDQISFFDIKELYDRAYAAKDEGRNDYKAKEMMAEAIKMDMAYRCQLARQSKYAKHSQMHDFKIISKAV